MEVPWGQQLRRGLAAEWRRVVSSFQNPRDDVCRLDAAEALIEAL
jgi:hypothetical protein